MAIEAGPPLATRLGETVGTLLPPLQLLETGPEGVDLGLQGLDGQASLLVLPPLDVEVFETGSPGSPVLLGCPLSEVGGGELLETLC